MPKFAVRSPRLLHVAGRFGDPEADARVMQVIEALGPKLDHTFVRADGSADGDAQARPPSTKFVYRTDFPQVTGKPTPGKLARLASAMTDYDLVLTYGWAATNAAMAHTLFKDAKSLPPLVHHEYAFAADERSGLKTRRNWLRRLAFGKSAGLVVATEALEEAALVAWQQPMGRVKHIPGGIAVRDYSVRPKPDSLLALIKHSGERWLGCFSADEGDDDLTALVQACAKLGEEWNLVVAGEVRDPDPYRAEADRLHINDRVHFIGTVRDTPKFLGLCDIYVFPSSEPPHLREAMAAALPVAGIGSEPIRALLAEENLPFVAGGTAGVEEALSRLAHDKRLRKSVGEANRQRALAEFDAKRMIDRHRQLYASAMRRDDW
ncbi:glycosyltransferase family 4 protein [Qipengyuania atrilutea]|uniref:Glycosyltransferase family 4 protein n=1 Tax=Qipengyuania atrilutea TaxID=2744473 RepID=A0A850H8I9_9SPHN|nr:glycosyltransferase family 4 protein [Actirhodobacter atriluteus]NVD45575.1 glycosyltransferase family 4 protein [Actirhodobacter atriluteus]